MVIRAGGVSLIPRTPYRPKDPNHSAVGVRMGTLGGSHRQKSFFDQDDYQPSTANRVGVAKYRRFINNNSCHSIRH